MPAWLCSLDWRPGGLAGACLTGFAGRIGTTGALCDGHAQSRSGAETLPNINVDFLIKPDGIQDAVVSACQQDEKESK